MLDPGFDRDDEYMQHLVKVLREFLCEMVSLGALKIQKFIVLCLCVLLMAGVSSADIRFHGSGSWYMLEGVGQTESWQDSKM